MSIEAEIIVTLAEVEVTDDYRVELSMHEPKVAFTWSEAEQLANELIEAVVKARGLLAEDFPGAHIHVHAFDIAPICKDCADGHHGACIGSAYVERGIDVDEVACGCAESGHNMGDAA